MASRVALVRGGDRFRNILGALEAAAGDVRPGERIVVKPNLVSISRPLAVTHAEALRAVLEFLRARTSREIVVAEGPAASGAMAAFAAHGLDVVAARYGCRLVDLNRDRGAPVEVVDRDGRPLRLRVARTVAESDFLISLAIPKTHDTVGVTLAVKNLVMGSLIRRSPDVGRAADRFLRWVGGKMPPRDRLVPRALDAAVRWLARSDKLRMHQTYASMNWNLHLIARAFPAHLAVLDGMVGMEGAGPTGGDPVELGIAIASTDPVAADAVASRIMGFDPDEIGYLHHAARAGLGEIDPARIEVVGGARVEDCLRPFRPHPLWERGRAWRDVPVSIADPIGYR